MKLRQMGAELFHTDGRKQTDRHDEANSCFSQFCERAKERVCRREILCSLCTHRVQHFDSDGMVLQVIGTAENSLSL
jgi:uncharacterized protein (DUF849 family)